MTTRFLMMNVPFFFQTMLPLCVAAATCFAADTAPGQELPTSTALTASAVTTGPSVLFIGNSFTFGAGSAVQRWRVKSVTDLNGEGIGGVPALFKALAAEAGREYRVCLETAPGKGLDWHLANRAGVLARPWDFVVMHGYSTMDAAHPGDPALLVRSAKEMADLLREQNRQVDIRLLATWSRADQTYPEKGHWHGQRIEKMALDVRAGYDLAAAAGKPGITGVIPVGEAWNLAMKVGVADSNPYDGITTGQVDLWTKDHYHGSAFGYYLSALMVFGDLTGLDPRSLGKGEGAAAELGISGEQAAALQRVAFEELTAAGRAGLKAFVPVALGR